MRAPSASGVAERHSALARGLLFDVAVSLASLDDRACGVDADASSPASRARALTRLGGGAACGAAATAVACVALALPRPSIDGLSPRVVLASVIVAVTAVAVGALLDVPVDLASAASARRRLARQLAEASVRLWPTTVALCALPLAPRELTSSLVAAAAVAAAIRIPPAPRAADAAAAWQLGLLGLAACLSVWYVAAGATLAGSADNDGAYYFGMARHFVESHRFDEPIVWQFLVKPDALLHRPFDYWPGLLSLLLTPVLAVFGATYHVAGAFMGAVTAAGIMAFAYLVSVAAPLRSRAVQLVAVLLFALSPALIKFRLDTETIPLVHLWLVLALIGFARRRFAMSALCAFLMFLSRSDTGVLAAIVWAGLGVAVLEDRAPRRAIAGLAIAIVVPSALFVGYHLYVFGTPAPPGALLASRLSDGTALYRWTGSPATLSFDERTTATFVGARVLAAVTTLQQATFFPNYSLWLAFALVSGLEWTSDRRGVDTLSRALLFVGACVISIASPAVFASWRTLHTILPAFVFAGAAGADHLLERSIRFMRAHVRAPVAVVVMAAALPFAGARAMLDGLGVELHHPDAPAYEADLAALSGRLGDRPVMTPHPWYVFAATRAPAVEVPIDGEAAIGAVMRRYHPRWFLLLNGETIGGAPTLAAELRAHTRHAIDGIGVTEAFTNARVSLYEIAAWPP